MKLIVSLILTIILGIVTIIFLILDYSYIISIFTNKKMFYFINSKIINISIFSLVIFFVSFFVTSFWTLIVLLKREE
jgi:hypothetical protein